MIVINGQSWCPRRRENGAMPGPNGEPPIVFPTEDTWRGPGGPYEKRTCSYCGSWHPEDLFKYIAEGGEVGPTDKDYKIYVPQSPQKFYFQHFSREDKIMFVDLLNRKAIKFDLLGTSTYRLSLLKSKQFM